MNGKWYSNNIINIDSLSQNIIGSEDHNIITRLKVQDLYFSESYKYLFIVKLCDLQIL